MTLGPVDIFFLEIPSGGLLTRFCYVRGKEAFWAGWLLNHH